MSESNQHAGHEVPHKALTEIAMGFSRSRMLAAAARLGLADAMGVEPQPVDRLASACAADPDSLYRLLRALASFGVVAETSVRHFILTDFGRPLRKDAPNSEWAAVVFWADLLADNWSYLTECVRKGENAGRIMERQGRESRWSQDPEARAIFGAVMGTSLAEKYAPLASAWNFSERRVIADLGGGGGGLLAAILHAHPNVRGLLVDRPEFIDKAALRFETEGLAERVHVLGGDLMQNVPAGADVYVLKHVLHGYDDGATVRILENCRAALPVDGRVLVFEFVLPDLVDRADIELERRLTSDLNMLAVTGGKERSADQWKTLLAQAGLNCRGIAPIPSELVSLIEADDRR